MEEGVLVRVVRMVLWTRKGKIGRLKMTEVEQRTLGWDFGGGFMHKYGCQNEGTSTIL